MINVYFNYPNSRVVIHAASGCAHVRQQKKTNQRIVRVNRESLSAELQRVKAREYRFASEASSNDLWLTVDLADNELELAVVKHVHRQLAKHYKRFADATLQTHCSQ